MPYVHQFGIIDCLDHYIEDEYEPLKYHCISIDGDFIDEINLKGFSNKMKHLNTYAHNINRPFKNLAYFGITLIPPASFDYFLTILREENLIYHSEELVKLINLITKAKAQNKWVLHYGV